jgi:uncharacterized membrane protein YbhN (UPF0104 family)
MRPGLRLTAMLAGFVGGTALGVWWAAPSSEILARTWHELAGLGPGNAVILVGLAAVVLLAEMIRLWVFGRALGVHVGARASFDASIANDLFTWISPGGLLGEPVSVYVMARRGVPVDASLVISFGKFATSFAFIMGLAGLLLGLGYGPPIAAWAIVSIVATVGFGVVLCGSFLVGAVWPETSLRWIARGEQWLERRPLLRGPRGRRAVAAGAGIARRSIERMAKFRAAGVRGWLAMFASHVLYYGAYIGLIVVLAHMFGARELGPIVPLAIIYLAFTQIAPAPGIAEAGAGVFFGHLLPDGGAFAVVLLYRALTAYLQIALALTYLPLIGALRSILEQQRPPRQPSGLR